MIGNREKTSIAACLFLCHKNKYFKGGNMIQIVIRSNVTGTAEKYQVEPFTTMRMRTASRKAFTKAFCS